MTDLGKLLVFTGLFLIVAGAVLWSGIGRSWLGRLPGDIHYTNAKGNFSFYFPVITCVILSLALSLLMRIFRK